MNLRQVIEEVFAQPAIPYEPQRHSLKAWATYCLRDRGFKVVYAQGADFAIEYQRNKVYFNVTTPREDLDSTMGWIVWDAATQQTHILLPQP
ncbi:MAG: hypothetical protein KME16_20065 [Scytolyngbya sp. HA4215-MV1]|nr:hypothetical protein [Scytolyngbya sp. HA4215-MV1]